MDDNSRRVTDEEALLFHSSGRPGKIEIAPTKPLTTQRDLSLAYSPGVAAPCLRIHEDPSTAYDYTAKGNIVAVISNGTAVLGLGDLGALASKPVMEGKAVLFKRFADIDGIDLEVDTRDVDEFVNCVRFLGKTWGGINLEDIRAPECFMIEQRLRELLDIPVFHDDQHGTAIVTAAGLINALDLTGRKLQDIKVVVNGAGAASIACVELIKSMGVPAEQVILCDTKGVIYEGRTEGMNQWKSAHAVKTEARSLADAMRGADVFLGLSVRGAVTPQMVADMAPKPIIFAMANPDPEITPEEAREVRSDAIIATGRSDYPNQINNVLGFPFIFRGALDVRASTINEAMKIAAAEALAKLAREEVPEELEALYAGSRMHYGADYIIPVPFDPRLISAVPPAVAKAAMDSGVARKQITDLDAYARSLGARMDPTSAVLQATFENARANPRRVVFAEGEEERVVRAALAFKTSGFGTPILIGRENEIDETMNADGLASAHDIEVHHGGQSRHAKRYADFLYKRLQRHGYLPLDCQRLVSQDRDVFAACMVAMGDADAMVTGLTRGFQAAFEDVTRVIDVTAGSQVFGLSMLQVRGGSTVFISDSHVHDEPSPEVLATIAIQSAAKARQMGHEPRVAFVSFANFGNPPAESAERIKRAMKILDGTKVDFEYDGEMSAAVALDQELLKAYPFCRLSAPANVLVVPSRDAAGIACKLMQKLGGGTIVGPLLIGLEKPVQIVSMSASVSELVTAAVLAAAGARR
jgi:malate dehydrogenase (oxaloacetate-decarboxylating)(NADP+)